MIDIPEPAGDDSIRFVLGHLALLLCAGLMVFAIIDFTVGRGMRGFMAFSATVLVVGALDVDAAALYLILSVLIGIFGVGMPSWRDNGESPKGRR
ncbi:MAG TPA: hypothetical protein VHN37_14955 [Actinomycetota bacterium]|nr:hypothetical protein [Actinomycetota bacterium]